MTELLPEELVSPVHADDVPESKGEPEDGIALCLSGGGYRAMLFHLGSLWRLNELGLLKKLKRISSVSGGSITSAMLGLKWGRLQFDADGKAARLVEEVVVPVRSLADHTIDVPSIAAGALLPGSIADQIAGQYRRHLYGDATLQDLPDDPPRFVINATSVQTGVLFRFMKPAARDYRVGQILNPKIPLAVAVAASSAFPPVLSPMRLEFRAQDWAPPDETNDLHFPPYTTNVVLTDGGVYDNLGLETAWKRYKTLLISDGGGKLVPDPEPKLDWARHGYQAVLTIFEQVGKLRRRQLMESFRRQVRTGTFWSVSSDMSAVEVPDRLACPFEKTQELAAAKTRLRRVEPGIQERLINWGYAAADTAIRAHTQLGSQASKPVFPYAGGV